MESNINKSKNVSLNVYSFYQNNLKTILLNYKMPIIKIRRRFVTSKGITITIISSNIALATINFFYDYVYCPIKKCLNKTPDETSDEPTNNYEAVLSILDLIEDKNIYNDLLFCLENKDNTNEKHNIELLICKYNKKIDTNITCICNYLIQYFNIKDGVYAGKDKSDSNKIYYIDL